MLFQIDMKRILHGNTLTLKKRTLLMPSRNKSSTVVDHAKTGILSVVFRHAENFTYKPGVFIPANQLCNLTVSSHTSLGDFFYNR